MCMSLRTLMVYILVFVVMMDNQDELDCCCICEVTTCGAEKLGRGLDTI